MTLPPDPMKEIRETLKAFRFQDPMNEMREALKAIQHQDAAKAMRDALKAVQHQDAAKAMRDALKAIQLQDPMKAMLDAMKATQLQDPLKGMRDAMKAIQLQDPLKEAREAMKALRFPYPVKDKQEVLKTIQLRRVNEAREAMNAVNALMGTASPRAWSLAYENLTNEIVVRDDNAVAVGSATLTRSEIQSFVDQIVDKANAQSAGQIEKALSAIVTEIASLRNPLLEKVLTWFVFPFILAAIFAIINPVADHYIKDALTKNDRQIKKDIKKHVLTAVGNSPQLDSYRFVSVKRLDAHMNPSAKSPVLGSFRSGQAVRMIEKNNDWSLVAWSDDEDRVALQGWVFSRYLNKFR